MANFTASFFGLGRGMEREWTLTFDDQADTITITARHEMAGGGTAPDPQAFGITFTLNGGASLQVNLLNGDITPGGFFTGQQETLLNVGPKVRSGVRLRLSADRAQAITYTTNYVPPA